MIMAEIRPLENFDNDGNVPKKRKTIKRQPLKDRSKPVEYNVQLESYDGPRNPAMPFDQALQNVPPLMLLVLQVQAKKHAENSDFSFFRDHHIDAKCPEYNGYNTRIHRQAGSQPKPHTEVAFVPLIDQPPAHHDTVKTAIARGLSLAKTEGEDVLIFTADQQLTKLIQM